MSAVMLAIVPSAVLAAWLDESVVSKSLNIAQISSSETATPSAIAVLLFSRLLDLEVISEVKS